jgi:GTP cyclohydrolase I
METERPATQVVEDPVRTVDLDEAAEQGIRAMLQSVPCSPAVREETPLRVLRAWYEMVTSESEEPLDVLLGTRFPSPSDDLIILKDIEFVSMCEHHLMPFMGQAHIGYLPEGYVVGISKLARLVDRFAKRLQLQERLCADIAGAMTEYVSQRGTACVIEASHGCVSCRGVRKARATFITSSMHGAFRENIALRQEFFAAIHGTHSRI